MLMKVIMMIVIMKIMNSTSYRTILSVVATK